MKMLKLGSRSNRFPFFPHHQLASVLGGFESLLPSAIIEKFQTGNHNRILFASENVTPICKSLQVLYITSIYKEIEQIKQEFKDKDAFKARWHWENKLRIALAIFLLRHLPQVQKLVARFYAYSIRGDFMTSGATAQAVVQLFN